MPHLEEPQVNLNRFPQLGEPHNLGIKERYKALMMMEAEARINYKSNSNSGSGGGTLTSSRNLFNNQVDMREGEESKSQGGPS